MALARYGTCGVIDETVTAGDIMVPAEAILLQENYDHDPKDEKSVPFYMSKPCAADSGLHAVLMHNFQACFGDKAVHGTGLNATCDTFYVGQGRKLTTFRDSCPNLLELIKSKYPKHQTLEMEMYCV